MNDKPSWCYESGCPLSTKGHGFCLGTGDPTTSSLVVIGDAPTSDDTTYRLDRVAGKRPDTVTEDVTEIRLRKRDYPNLDDTFLQKGKAFSGPHSVTLNYKLLRFAGYRRSDVYVDNVLRCVPPRTKAGVPYPTGDERKRAEACCRHYDRLVNVSLAVVTLHPHDIQTEITPLPLMLDDSKKAGQAARLVRTVLLLGGKATKWFLGYGENTTKWRGHWTYVTDGLRLWQQQKRDEGMRVEVGKKKERKQRKPRTKKGTNGITT